MARAESDGAVENPLAAEGFGSGGLAASGEAATGSSSGVGQDIEAGLKDGTLTAEQAVALAEKKMEAKAAQMIGAAHAAIMRAAAQLSAALNAEARTGDAEQLEAAAAGQAGAARGNDAEDTIGADAVLSVLPPRAAPHRRPVDGLTGRT
eukprot:COSAG04_NODE_2934_length_3374_cov_1.368855_2_plen_150_part_00